MALHKAHTHGRAFHGHEARELLELEKRSGQGSRIKLNVPVNDNKYNFIHMAGKATTNKDVFIHDADKSHNVVTVISEVYVTEAKTFSGPAVYVTQTGTTPIAPAVTSSTTQNSYESVKSKQHSTKTKEPYESIKAKQHSTKNPYESVKSEQHKGHVRSSAAVSATSAAGAGALGGTPLHTSRGPTVAKGTPLSASRSANPELISTKHSGMTSGGKAGLALGILAILGITAGLILFCIRRRKQQLQDKGEKLDEKHVSQNSFFSGTAAAMDSPAGEKRQSVKSVSSFASRTGATAPRLSLRPITSLLPNVLSGYASNNNNNAAATPAMSEKPKAQNPFSDAAMLSEKQARPTSPPSNPFEDGEGKNANTPNHSAKPSWASSDAGAQVGTAAAVAVGAAGTARGPNNVHRVQLDFKPSMDDELELKSGQLVRMLHEYDDGWALCIRMDRSQQGVCPRTCLSKLPVKPRPNGPPPAGAMPPKGRPGPGMRGPPPPGGNKMMPQPLVPNGRERSNTAGGPTSPSAFQEAARNRSQSVSAAERPVSPSEAGVPARKPVPGQAI